VHTNVCGGLEEGSNLKRSQPSNTAFYKDKVEALTSHSIYFIFYCKTVRDFSSL
jgi:hypothetical protein